MEYEFVFKASKQLSSKLSNIDVMSLAISAVFVPSFQQVFAYMETSYVKASNFIINQNACYRSSSFSLNES